MNRRLASVFLFALLVSAVASLVVYYFVVTNVQAASRKPVSAQKVLVAAHNLEVGALIHNSDLRWQSVANLPSGEIINDPKAAAGRGVIATIYEGEPITSGRLAPQGAGAGLASMIPIGKRAVALKVDEVVGLAGFVVPGMRVDVIVAGRSVDNTQNNILSRTALQNIEVLSAGQKIEKTADGRPQDAQVVNLLVTPDQAEILSLVGNETKVQLVLRNPLDTQQQTTHGASLATILGVNAPPPSVKSAPQPRLPRTVAIAPARPVEPATVEVFSGVKKSEQTLPAQQ